MFGSYGRTLRSARNSYDFRCELENMNQKETDEGLALLMKAAQSEIARAGQARLEFFLPYMEILCAQDSAIPKARKFSRHPRAFG